MTFLCGVFGYTTRRYYIPVKHSGNSYGMDVEIKKSRNETKTINNKLDCL